MPTLIVKTNVSMPTDQHQALLKRASQQVAQALGKPEAYVMVLLEMDQLICFGGDTSPAAFLELKSLGLPEDKTAQLSATLCDFVSETLEVPPSRVYIEFASPPRHLFGFNRATF